ncbi:hypothetical protein HYFRA_00011792 [Hymenoscyphus fraxineus]|uniref:Uncharacterized protein n=1 Tax=Hymenoscyphus fraxineus TaxID=746836 RepID=A0A9N9L2R5_9HELO|nr:hypothetical protein HYFRA_00011792 [Hymenoscyphus fraxineus]
MCHGAQITYRCCGKQQNRIIPGGQCEDAEPCGRIWGRSLIRRQCTSCRRQQVIETRRANQNYARGLPRAKALLEYLQGNRPSPLTNNALDQRVQEQTERYWDQWKVGTRLHPFPRGSRYIDIVRRRFDEEARVGWFPYAIIRPQMWEECLRRQREIDASPRALSSVDKSFDFTVVLNGERTTEADHSTEQQAESSGEALPIASLNRVSSAPLLPLPLGTVTEPPASVTDGETIWQYGRRYSADSLYSSPTGSDESSPMDLDEDYLEDYRDEEQENILSFAQWSADAQHKRREAGTEMSERYALPLDVQDYLDYLGLQEGTALQIVNFRSFSKFVEARPFRFYPSATPGRRQLLPLSAWLTVRFCDGQKETYMEAIEEYKLYVQQCGTQQQFNEYVECLNTHAAINREILTKEGDDAVDMSLWAVDRILPQPPFVWARPTVQASPFYRFLDVLGSEDSAYALPIPPYEPPNLVDLQTQEMLRLHSQQAMMFGVSSETIPESTNEPTVEARRFTWTDSDDGSDDENDLGISELSEVPASPTLTESSYRQFTGSNDGSDDENDLEISESSEVSASPTPSETTPSETTPSESLHRRLVWAGSDDENEEDNEVPRTEGSSSSDPVGLAVTTEAMCIEEDMAWERTRAMFRAQEEEDVQRRTLGPWTLEQAEDGVIVSLLMDSEDEDGEDEANWVHGDRSGTESWLQRDRDRVRHAVLQNIR